MRTILLFLIVSFITLFARNNVSAQDPTGKSWATGYYYDLKGNKFPGLLSGHIYENNLFDKAGDYIWFKSDQSAAEHKVRADSIKAFVASTDSFVVSHSYEMKRMPFMRVIVNEPVKLYEIKIKVYEYSTTLIFTKVSNEYDNITYYYGADPDNLTLLRKGHFLDEMTKIFASQPALLEEIKYQDYTFANMEEIIGHYFWYKQHELKAKSK